MSAAAAARSLADIAAMGAEPSALLVALAAPPGLPVSWAKYADSYYWSGRSVRNSPLYRRYEPRLTDAHMAEYFLTHPGQILSVGKQAASEGLRVRVTTLGDYPPSAGRPP